MSWRAVLLAIVLSLPNLCFSQSDFRKGYIITNKQDTVFGLINYKENTRAHKYCDFKESETKHITTYEPDQIAGYGFVGDSFFESRTIDEQDKSLKRAFLEVLVKGQASLYKLNGVYWIEKDGHGFHKLTNETIETETVEGRTVARSTNKHIATLNTLFFDCEELRSRIKNASLTAKSLSTITEEYNKCKGSPGKVFKANKHWIKASIGVAGGLNASRLAIKTTSRDHEQLTGTFETTFSPIVGLPFDLSSPRITERLSFNGAVFYSNSKYNRSTSIDERNYSETNYINIEIKELKIPFGMRYTFQIGKLRPYGMIGVSTTIHLNSNSIWIREITTYDVVKKFVQEPLLIKENQFGFWGGAGIERPMGKKLNAFIELRYEITNGITPFMIDVNNTLESRITNFQILLGIKTR
jgi:hypothetical protein